MIISPITKEELKLKVVQVESRDLRQIHRNNKHRTRMQRRKKIMHNARRQLAVAAVPIILKFPFKAAIPQEYTDFKCNVLTKNAEKFENNVNDICTFQGIITEGSNE